MSKRRIDRRDEQVSLPPRKRVRIIIPKYSPASSSECDSDSSDVSKEIRLHAVSVIPFSDAQFINRNGKHKHNIVHNPLTINIFSNVADNKQCSIIYNTLESISSNILENTIIPSDILKVIAFHSSGYVRICDECKNTEIFILNDQRYKNPNELYFNYKGNNKNTNISYDFIFCKECIVYGPTIDCVKCGLSYPITQNVNDAYRKHHNKFDKLKIKTNKYFRFVENIAHRWFPEYDSDSTTSSSSSSCSDVSNGNNTTNPIKKAENHNSSDTNHNGSENKNVHMHVDSSILDTNINTNTSIDSNINTNDDDSKDNNIVNQNGNHKKEYPSVTNNTNNINGEKDSCQKKELNEDSVQKSNQNEIENENKNEKQKKRAKKYKRRKIKCDNPHRCKVICNICYYCSDEEKCKHIISCNACPQRKGMPGIGNEYFDLYQLFQDIQYPNAETIDDLYKHPALFCEFCKTSLLCFHHDTSAKCLECGIIICKFCCDKVKNQLNCEICNFLDYHINDHYEIPGVLDPSDQNDIYRRLCRHCIMKNYRIIRCDTCNVQMCHECYQDHVGDPHFPGHTNFKGIDVHERCIQECDNCGIENGLFDKTEFTICNGCKTRFCGKCWQLKGNCECMNINCILDICIDCWDKGVIRTPCESCCKYFNKFEGISTNYSYNFNNDDNTYDTDKKRVFKLTSNGDINDNINDNDNNNINNNEIDRLFEVTCENCGIQMDDDSLITCNGCQSDCCRDCMKDKCFGCGYQDQSNITMSYNYCQNCLNRCNICENWCCDECINTCQNCDEKYCLHDSCSSYCADCENNFCVECSSQCAHYCKDSQWRIDIQ